MSTIANEEVRLAEFARLRAEIDQRTAIQQALIALNLTVAGTVTGIVAGGSAPEGLLLAIVFISCTFGILWLDHHLAIHQIAGYIESELWNWHPSWESYIRDKPKPIWWRIFFMLAIGLAFGGVAGAAAVAVKSDLSATVLCVMWWVGVALTTLTITAFLLIFSWGPARLK